MKKLLVFLSMLVFGAGAVYALPKPIDSLQQLGQMGLAWGDDFNGTSLDTINSWSNDTGPVYNAEQELYKRACIEVNNGRLIVWSRHNLYGVTYPSGRVDTHDKKIFTYGYFEAAIQGPVGTGGKNGPGLWSAVWLLGNSIHHGVAWPTCGEMELYEQRTCSCVVPANAPQPVPAIAGDNEFIACCHYGVGGAPSYHSCQYNYTSCLCGGFHKYGVFWDTNFVKYYFDDIYFWGPNFPSATYTTPSITQAANQVAFSSPMYWIINVAVGGAYQGQNIDQTIFPTHMDLDYVRVYQRGVVPTGVVNGVKKAALPSFALVNPSTAQLRVYDLRGKMVADYTNKVRQMKAGDNVMKAIPVPAMLSRGAYIVRLFDNGNSLSQTLVSTK